MPTERFRGFDGLRAIAALAIVFHHVGFITGEWFTDHRVWGTNLKFPGGALLARGDIGVAIFFVISGFLLYRPFVAAHLGGQPMPDLRRYGRRRILRIFPAYWVALAGVLAFSPLAFDRASEWISGVGLLHIYGRNTILQMNPGFEQTWTLATEVSFYLFLPAYAWSVRRCGRDGMKLSAEICDVAGLYIFGIAFRWLVDPMGGVGIDPTGGRSLSRYWLPANFDLFALGMGLAIASAWFASQPRPNRCFDAVVRIGGWWWAAAAGTYFLVAVVVLGDSDPNVRGLGTFSAGQDLARQILYGLTALLFLIPVVFSPPGTSEFGMVRKFLGSRAMTAIGMASYGIYLWHQAIRNEVYSLVTGNDLAHPFMGSFGPVLLLTLALAVAAGTVSYYCIERPLMGWREERK